MNGLKWRQKQTTDIIPAEYGNCPCHYTHPDTIEHLLQCPLFNHWRTAMEAIQTALAPLHDGQLPVTLQRVLDSDEHLLMVHPCAPPSLYGHSWPQGRHSKQSDTL